MRRKAAVAIVLACASVVASTGCSATDDPSGERSGTADREVSTDSPTDEPDEANRLATAIEAAFEDSYGWKTDPLDPAMARTIQAFSDRDAPRVTVVTSLSDAAGDEQTAKNICMTVASLGINDDLPDFTGVYVTAGDGGPIIAECDAVKGN